MMPTPNTMDHLPCRSEEAMQRQFNTARKGRSAPGNLREYINPKMWPTPKTSDGTGGASIKRISELNHLKAGLREAVHWPTPTASDHRDRGGPKNPSIKRRIEIGKSIELSMTVDGALNPGWVEWLMGWPIGWTSLENLESAEFLPLNIEPDIPRTAKRSKNHKERLQALGNGQVPATVEKAYKLLCKRTRFIVK